MTVTTKTTRFSFSALLLRSIDIFAFRFPTSTITDSVNIVLFGGGWFFLSFFSGVLKASD